MQLSMFRTYESWLDSGIGYSYYGSGTGLATEWEKFQKRNKNG
jgi:hypothetical protein